MIPQRGEREREEGINLMSLIGLLAVSWYPQCTWCQREEELKVIATFSTCLRPITSEEGQGPDAACNGKAIHGCCRSASLPVLHEHREAKHAGMDILFTCTRICTCPPSPGLLWSETSAFSCVFDQLSHPSCRCGAHGH